MNTCFVGPLEELERIYHMQRPGHPTSSELTEAIAFATGHVRAM